jgi:quercetin dioxygenase-like cupin family protein
MDQEKHHDATHRHIPHRISVLPARCRGAGARLGYARAAAELNPAALVYKLPDQLQWRDPTGAAGINQAVLQGDPSKPGLYVVLNRFKPGNFSKPHFHPNDRFITVVKGTWWVATGNKVDMSNIVPMPTGSFVTHFGKQVHWDGAKDEEAWVLIVGEGPGTLTRVEEAK